MIDICTETPLTLTEAAKSLPSLDGRRISTATLWRWARKGVRGVRLDYVRLGRRVVTTKESLSRFAARLAEADRVADAETSALERQAAECRIVAPISRSAGQREREINAARKRCVEAGLV